MNTECYSRPNLSYPVYDDAHMFKDAAIQKKLFGIAFEEVTSAYTPTPPLESVMLRRRVGQFNQQNANTTPNRHRKLRGHF